MVDTCHVTGTLIAPDGSPLPRVAAMFQRLPERAFVAGDSTAMPHVVRHVTSETGAVSVHLVPGPYLVRLQGASYPPFRIDVPDEPTANLADIQDDILQPPPSRIIEAVDEAKEARDEAVGAKGAAEEAAARAEAARAAARTIFPSTAAGLAATTDGDYFSVPSESDDEYLILYRNDNGSATEVRRYPSAEAVDAATQRVDDLAGSEELQSIRVIEGGDYSVAYTDLAGNVAGGFDERGRFVARIGQQVEQFEVETGGQYVWGITDEAWRVALGVDRAGNAAASGLNLPGYEIRSLNSPGISFAITDDQGRAAFIVYEDGTTSAGSGGGDDPQPITHTVIWSFAEPIDDPSKELFLTWLTDSPDAKVLEYRPRGGQAWMAASSFRTRPFPVLANRWLHTVRLEGLTPDTVYDIRVPGSHYADAVKTCPAIEGLKVMLASDWQRSDYSSESPLRILGDIASGEQPDLLIFNGDLNTHDGRYTSAWAQDFVTIFQVLHDHYRGRERALLPWMILYGNHEAVSGSGGSGTPGMIDDICSWTYSEFHEGRFTRGVGTVRIRDMAAFVALETNHTVPLLSQLDWFKDQLDTHCPEVAHAFAVGHVGPFNVFSNQYVNSTTRSLRNLFWPYAETHAGPGGSFRAFLSAHSHVMLVTPKLKMAYDPDAPATVNDDNYYRDADGIYNLGYGMLGGPPVTPNHMDRVSNIDGQPFWDACIGNNGEGDYQAFGNVLNPQWPFNNLWMIYLTRDGWSAKCFNLNGDLFYHLDETGGQ